MFFVLDGRSTIRVWDLLADCDYPVVVQRLRDTSDAGRIEAFQLPTIDINLANADLPAGGDRAQKTVLGEKASCLVLGDSTGAARAYGLDSGLATAWPGEEELFAEFLQTCPVPKRWLQPPGAEGGPAEAKGGGK